MSDAQPIEVEIVCATRSRQVLRGVCVEAGCSVAEAVRRSAVLDEFPQLDPQTLSYAVFGARVAADQPLNAGDRVEILRALVVDPREARRKRAALRASNKRTAGRTESTTDC